AVLLPGRALIGAIVRCFLGDLHVVHMRLADAGRRNFDELGARAQGVDRRTAAIPHRGANAAHELVNHRGDRALVRHPPLDTFGHQLFGGALTLRILEIAIARALLHRTQRAHAAIALVRAALEELGLTR